MQGQFTGRRFKATTYLRKIININVASGPQDLSPGIEFELGEIDDSYNYNILVSGQGNLKYTINEGHILVGLNHDTIVEVFDSETDCVLPNSRLEGVE